MRFNAEDIYSAITDREDLERQLALSGSTEDLEWLESFLENPPNLVLIYNDLEYGENFDIEVEPAFQEPGENGYFINMSMRSADIIGKQDDPAVIDELEKAAKAVADMIEEIEECNRPDWRPGGAYPPTQ